MGEVWTLGQPRAEAVWGLAGTWHGWLVQRLASRRAGMWMGVDR